MHVYKAFFKVMTKYKLSIIIYTTIVIFMLFSLINAYSASEEEDVAEKKYTLLIVDNDNSELSKELVKFLGTKHYLEDGSYTDEQIKDMLYYQYISEYIVIPEGFGEKYEKASENSEASSLLQATYDEALPKGIFINMQIDQYLNAVKDYMNSGYTLEEASAKCTDAMDSSKYVSMQKKETVATQRVYTSFQFLPFGILTIIFSGVLPVIMCFNDAERKNRTIISSYKMTKRNFELILGSASLALVVTSLLVGLASASQNSEYIFTTSWWLSVTNSFVYTLSVTMLLSMITSLPLGINTEGSANTSTFITCIIGLSFSFLGGTFVDITILGDKVAKIGQFTPNYWYSVASRKIWYEGGNLSDVAESFGMQLLFGLVCLSIGLCFTRFFGEKKA